MGFAAVIRAELFAGLSRVLLTLRGKAPGTNLCLKPAHNRNLDLWYHPVGELMLFNLQIQPGNPTKGSSRISSVPQLSEAGEHHILQSTEMPLLGIQL